MLANMANTSNRALRLLALLQTHRFWPGTELAERLDVSIRTLRRDVERLRELGYPVEASRGVEGGYQLAAGAALPPLVVDDEEAVAIAVALQHLAAAGTGEVIAEAAVRALAKVVQVMPTRLRRRVDALRTMIIPASFTGTTARIDPAVLATLAQACRDSERVEFGYTARDGVPSERHAEPHRLVALDRRWYLVGYDLSRHDWRSFRIDRLREPRRTGSRFLPRELPARDAAEFVRNGILQQPKPYTVEAVVHAPVEHVRERIGRWSEIEPLGEEYCRVRMVADSLDWTIMALGLVGAEFELLGPPELREQLADLGARFTRAAAG